jgi:hypothetical protein
MWDLRWRKWQWDRFLFEFFGSPPLMSFHHGYQYSYINWGMNNMPVRGHSSETQSHSIDTNNNKSYTGLCIHSTSTGEMNLNYAPDDRGQQNWRAFVNYSSVIASHPFYVARIWWITSILKLFSRIFPLVSVYRPALRPTQPPIQWGAKDGRGVTLTTHSHLVTMSIMSKSYNPLPLGGCMV